MTRLIYMRAINILVPPLVEICIEIFNENMPRELVSFGSSLSCEIGHADVYPDSRGLSQDHREVSHKSHREVSHKSHREVSHKSHFPEHALKRAQALCLAR